MHQENGFALGLLVVLKRNENALSVENLLVPMASAAELARRAEVQSSGSMNWRGLTEADFQRPANGRLIFTPVSLQQY